MEAGKVQLRGKALHSTSSTPWSRPRTPRDDEDVATYERSACPTCASCSGMFTANSMNCLTEALGLSLPGNGSLLATHAYRKDLFLEAGRLVVDLARRWYEQDDASVLPRRDRELRGLRERDEPRHRHGRLHQHRAAPAGSRATRPASTSPCRTSTASAARCPTCARSRPPPSSTTWRTCTGRAASSGSSASSTAPG